MLGTSLLYAAVGTGFTFLMTTLGAAFVFFFRKEVNAVFHQMSLGFAAGVMMAASVWSLLIPAIETAGEQGKTGWILAGTGFVFGALFLMLLDKYLPKDFLGGAAQREKKSWKHTVLLVLAVTLHNIPEGMAVGLAFSLALGGTVSSAGMGAAVALAIGIGVQNLPEGAAISLPLRKEGFRPWKAFLYGACSGVVEPIFGVLSVLAAGTLYAVVPWLMAFAAGSMVYVVVQELIPDALRGENGRLGFAAVLLGFLTMMSLDVILG